MKTKTKRVKPGCQQEPCSAWVAEISDRLRITRHVRKLTLEDLAVTTGISKAMIGRLETPVGGSRMAMESVTTVSLAMGIEPAVMLGDRTAFVECLMVAVTAALSPQNAPVLATADAKTPTP